MAITPMRAVYANVAPTLPTPTALVVFTDKLTKIVVALSTDVEVERGCVMPHFFADFDTHPGVSLTASPGPQIGTRWPVDA